MKGQVISPHMEPLVVSIFLLCLPFQDSFGISSSVQKQLCPKWEKEAQPGKQKTDFSNGTASCRLQAAFCLGSVRYTTGTLLLCNQRIVTCYLLFGLYPLKSLEGFISLLWNTYSVYPAVNLIFWSVPPLSKEDRQCLSLLGLESQKQHTHLFKPFCSQLFLWAFLRKAWGEAVTMKQESRAMERVWSLSLRVRPKLCTLLGTETTPPTHGCVSFPFFLSFFFPLTNATEYL